MSPRKGRGGLPRYRNRFAVHVILSESSFGEEVERHKRKVEGMRGEVERFDLDYED